MKPDLKWYELEHLYDKVEHRRSVKRAVLRPIVVIGAVYLMMTVWVWVCQ